MSPSVAWSRMVSRSMVYSEHAGEAISRALHLAGLLFATLHNVAGRHHIRTALRQSVFTSIFKAPCCPPSSFSHLWQVHSPCSVEQTCTRSTRTSSPCTRQTRMATTLRSSERSASAPTTVTCTTVHRYECEYLVQREVSMNSYAASLPGAPPPRQR